MKTLNFPLYHGTSTLFLDSIKENGLGAINIVQEYNLHSILNDLYEVAESKGLYTYGPNWVDSGYLIKKVLNQASNERVNFQHGQVYLTPSLFTANMYAKSNKYGSEYIQLIIDTYHHIISKDPKFELKNDFIKSILKTEYSPIILQISNIPIEFLGTEKELTVEQVINEIQNKVSKGFEPQQDNFRLVTPISFNKIEIREL